MQTIKAERLFSIPFVPKIPLALCATHVAVATNALSTITLQFLLSSYAAFLSGTVVRQYALVFSLMTAALGWGALSSRKIKAHPRDWVLGIDTAIVLLSLLALPALYYASARNISHYVPLVGFVIALGMLLGTKPPLLGRTSGMTNGLTCAFYIDHAAGFLVGLAFPLLLLPKLGFFRTAGILCALHSLSSLGVLVTSGNERGGSSRRLWSIALALLTFGSLAFFHLGEPLRQYLELRLFSIQPNP